MLVLCVFLPAAYTSKCSCLIPSTNLRIIECWQCVQLAIPTQCHAVSAVFIPRDMSLHFLFLSLCLCCLCCNLWQVVKELRQKATSPSCHPLQQWMDLSDPNPLYYLSPHESASQTASHSVRLFLHSSPVCPTLRNMSLCTRVLVYTTIEHRPCLRASETSLVNKNDAYG